MNIFKVVEYLLNYFIFPDDKKFKVAAKQLLQQVNKVTQHSTDKLESLSPWLAQYHWYGGENYIELPGKYTGYAPPNNNTLKIVKFHDTVSILHSLRRPVKISVTCSDGKSHSFLIKYGEDLRQDDRIQQIQSLMADQMNSNKNCSQQKLSLRTYKVIPMNMHCGIISWIDNTETIEAFLSKSNPVWNVQNNTALQQYKRFLSKGQKDTNIVINAAAAINYTQKEVRIKWGF